MDLTIRPHVGVGPLTFGASIRDTRRALAEPLKALGRGWPIVSTFIKDPRRDALPADDFFDLGFHVYYRIEGARLVCDGVELFGRAAPIYDGVRLLSASFNDVRSWLVARDPSCASGCGTLISRGLGIALVPPDEDEPEKPVESVYVFPPGAYDRPLAPADDESA